MSRSTTPQTEHARRGCAERLHKIEGQVRGIAAMVSGDRPTLDVLTRLAAARAALSAVGLELIEAQLRDAIETGASPADAASATTVAAGRLLGCHTRRRCSVADADGNEPSTPHH